MRSCRVRGIDRFHMDADGMSYAGLTPRDTSAQWRRYRVAVSAGDASSALAAESVGACAFSTSFKASVTYPWL